MNMYEPFYGLRTTPFRLTPDPGFFFASGIHESAQAHLRYALHQGEGFVVVSGSPGTGKTVLMLNLLGELDPRRAVSAKIVSTNISADEILELVAHAFGVGTQGQSKGTWLKRLEEHFLAQARLGKRVVLFIDEAHHLSAGSISELAMLADFQLESLPVFQCFLLGQERLLDRLAEPRLRHVRQRVIASVELSPLSSVETKAYIEYRLSCAGWQGDPQFTRGAHEVIHRFTGGNPRQINVFCNRLLLSCYLDNVHRIDQQVVAQAAEEVLQEAVLAHAPVETLELNSLSEELQSTSEPPRQPGGFGRTPQPIIAASHKRREDGQTKPQRSVAEAPSARSEAVETEVDASTLPPSGASPDGGTNLSEATNARHTQATGHSGRLTAAVAVVVLVLGSAVYVFNAGELRGKTGILTGEESTPGPKRGAAASAGQQQSAARSEIPAAGAELEQPSGETVESVPASTEESVGAAAHTPSELAVRGADADPAKTPAGAIPRRGESTKETPSATPAGDGNARTESALTPQDSAPVTTSAAAVNVEPQANATAPANTAVATTRVSSVSTAELRRLLSAYCDAYEAGKLDQLLGLFAEDLRSNGKSGRDIIAQDYKRLFMLTYSRDMKLGGMTWRAGEAQMHGQGSFNLSVRDTTLRRVARYAGHIAFEVQNTKAGPIITKLNFSYDE